MTNDPPTFFTMFLSHTERPALWCERQSVTDQCISPLLLLMSTCTIIIAPPHLEIGPVVPGGGLLGLIFHEFGSWPLRTPTPLQSSYSMAKYRPQLSHCDGPILSCALDVLGCQIRLLNYLQLQQICAFSIAYLKSNIGTYHFKSCGLTLSPNINDILPFRSRVSLLHHLKPL